MLKEIITAIRDARNKNQLKPKDKIKLHIQSSGSFLLKDIETILLKQVNAASLNEVKDNVPNTISIVVQKEKLYIETETSLNTTNQKEQLLKDLEYQKGFLVSVEKKLSNERFVQNAKPEIIETERKKKADAEAKIKAIEKAWHCCN